MSTKPHNLPLLRKYADETFAAAAVVDRVLSGIASGVTISSVESTAIVRDTLGAVVSSGGPTLSSITKNSGTYTSPSDGATYAASTVITYSIAGGTAGTTYWVDFEFTPSSGGGPIVVRQPVRVD
jgi:hypothetical protein